MSEKQITFAEHGHMLTNTAVWSRDSRRIVYDTRTRADGSVFDGRRIETVDVESGEVRLLYESSHGAHCGVATYSPRDDTVVFILGPQHPTADWQYGFHRRQGVMVKEIAPGIATNLDARDLMPPFTAGALRGGTHLHLFSPDAKLVSFTYHDLLAPEREDHRNIGVSVLGYPVAVPKTHERNHDGSAFSVLVTQTTADPKPGSDEIRKASEEAWLGPSGRAIAFQGEVITADGRAILEVFVVDLPNDLMAAGDAPLEGSAWGRPAPPRGTRQRRLTFSRDGLIGPRHWVRSAPDGSLIAFLKSDDRAVVQLWTVSPKGGALRQVTHGAAGVESAFTWSPDGRAVALVINGAVGIVDVQTDRWRELVPRRAPLVRPEACVFSPDGKRVAYMRYIDGCNQLFTADSG